MGEGEQSKRWRLNSYLSPRFHSTSMRIDAIHGSSSFVRAKLVISWFTPNRSTVLRSWKTAFRAESSALPPTIAVASGHNVLLAHSLPGSRTQDAWLYGGSCDRQGERNENDEKYAVHSFSTCV